MSPTPRTHPLERQRLPQPPPDLAARVLAAAAIADGAVVSATWVDRLWESSAGRLLWATTLCGLLLGHLLATRPTPTPDPVPTSSGATASVAALLDVPASTLRAPVSRFRVPRFAHGPTLGHREQIEILIEESGR
jgi:hypothetical protein